MRPRNKSVQITTMVTNDREHAVVALDNARNLTKSRPATHMGLSFLVRASEMATATS